MFQFYPENPDQVGCTLCVRVVHDNEPSHPLQMELITQQAMRAGFTGGVVIDYPNSTRAKK